MNTQQQKATIQNTFDTVASGYDGNALRFFANSAAHMASLLDLRGDECLLDVACGTGNATFAVAPLLPRGKIIAVDFSNGMLAQARARAAREHVQNARFLERDMENLDLAPGSFDVAVCAFGIFFVEDMEGQLARISRMVRPGGKVMITNFSEDYFSPLKERLFERLESYGVARPPQTWRRIANETGCRQLLASAGLENIRIDTRDVGYALPDAASWWQIVWNGGFRRMVTMLPPSEHERFKQEHLTEIEALRTNDGIRLNVGVLFSQGSRA